jgi:hypothetical protein
MQCSHWMQARVILFALCLTAVLAGCAERESDEPTYDKARDILHVEWSGHLSELAMAHKSGNALIHLKSTTLALRLANRTSIRALLPEVDYLTSAIERDGLRPYLSLAIDLSYRLARLEHRQTQARFTSLARVMLAAQDREPARRGSKMMGLVRVRGGLRYRQYNENAVHAVGLLAASEFGRSQVQRGRLPQDIMRTAAMLWECTPKTQRDSIRNERSRQACHQFTELVASRLDKAGQRGLIPAITMELEQGILARTFACLEGNDIGSKLVEEIEAYTACMNAQQQQNPAATVADGAGITTEWNGTPPGLPGYQHDKSTETVRFGPNGNTGTQVDHYYTDGAGGTGRVSQFTSVVDGQESSGTRIDTDDGQGNTHTEFRNSNDEVMSSFDMRSDGSSSSYEKHSDGGATAVETNADGTSTVEHVDKDGNVTTAEIDENGACTGTACTASMPPGEEGLGNNCSLHGNPQDDLNEHTTDPLGPYIYPDPEGAGGRLADPMLACMLAALGSNSKSDCPPSVAMCLEPPPPGVCGCGGALNPGVTLPKGSGRCNSMMCAEGTCNPETGTCTSGGGKGASCPGIFPPVGPAQMTIELKSAKSFLPLKGARGVSIGRQPQTTLRPKDP